ncbi:MAG: NBR1-Ig-like domain-containing protein [Anaerolineae bacterium]
MDNRPHGTARVLGLVFCILLVSVALGGCDYVRPLLNVLPFIGPEPTDTPPAPTSTPLPSVTPEMAATVTPEPVTPEAETEAEPTATLMTGVLDSKFVRDISIPDGTVMAPGQAFTKSWEIENSGEVPWPDGTELRLVDGAVMGPIESVSLNGRTAGERAEISVDLAAPAAPGTHRSYWQLCVGDACFGARFFVEIRVEAP